MRVSGVEWNEWRTGEAWSGINVCDQIFGDRIDILILTCILIVTSSTAATASTRSHSRSLLAYMLTKTCLTGKRLVLFLPLREPATGVTGQSALFVTSSRDKRTGRGRGRRGHLLLKLS